MDRYNQHQHQHYTPRPAAAAIQQQLLPTQQHFTAVARPQTPPFPQLEAYPELPFPTEEEEFPAYPPTDSDAGYSSSSSTSLSTSSSSGSGEQGKGKNHIYNNVHLPQPALDYNPLKDTTNNNRQLSL